MATKVWSSGTGLPILIIAFLGSRIHQLVPNICSFTDFTNRRFGMVVQVSRCRHACLQAATHVPAVCSLHAWWPQWHTPEVGSSMPLGDFALSAGIKQSAMFAVHAPTTTFAIVTYEPA